ncbi:MULTISPECIES: sensor domain-containing diguanylate cyclase [unclassified Aeromicrobium]|uniref:sensor domain-containing diguanylate cyclase n=1 Tax=unclassified Aeromicrobium TaxID=2633570 RepID=UPI00288B830E|nr:MULTISPECIES: sensor domain-containing diguanylate cyclase [unclassified Aeromicrobium]
MTTLSRPADGTDSFSEVSHRVVTYLRTHTPISDWSVNRVVGGEQVHLHVEGDGLIAVGDRRDWADSFCRRVVDLGADPVVPDVTTHPDYRDLRIGDSRSYASQPIHAADGEMFGMLCGLGTSPLDRADDVDLDLLSLLTDLLGAHVSLARRLESGDRARRSAEALAQTDALTGLVNRRGWDALLADAAVRTSAYGDLAAVVVADVDGLKAVNDELGHTEGDAVLRRVAAALTAARRDGETAARYGGDEFAVLVEDVSPRSLGEMLRRYRASFAQHDVEVSVGWSLVYPGDEPADAAFRRADVSMYEDKRSRRVENGVTDDPRDLAPAG